MSRIETICNATLYLGDCLDVLKTLPTNSVDSVVCDPPYGLSFMGKKWDCDVPSVDIWAECLRVLKPGGHLLAFAGTRTQHRMAVRIEDAGFEIRDMIAWVYGSGFPKSLDVSKAIDKAAGAEREVVGVREDFARRAGLAERPNTANAGGYANPQNAGQITAPATEAARQWKGWGTALKPALEPITMARKPLVGTVAANVLAHGAGALNIDGCRVAGGSTMRIQGEAEIGFHGGNFAPGLATGSLNGRWPANLIHDGSDEVVAGFPMTKSGNVKPYERENRGGWAGPTPGKSIFEREGDTGSAARFFYCAKASKSDRGAGNTHPTVKPTDLMAYLCRLITPHGGVVLDPFMGSGSTGKAAIPEGFHFIGVECEPAYFDIACRRIEQAHAQGQLFEPTQAAPVQLGLEAA